MSRGFFDSGPLTPCLGPRVECPETEDADLPTQKWTPVWVKQRFSHIPQVNGDRFPSASVAGCKNG